MKKVFSILIVFMFIVSMVNSNAADAVKLQLGHIQQVNHPNAQGAEKFAELVKEKTNGEVVVECYPASQLGNEKDIFDGIAMGVIDMAVLGFGEPAKRYKSMMIFDAPFLAKNREHLVRIFNSDLISEIFAATGKKTKVLPIAAFYYGTRHLTTADKPVKSPADLEGMKIRCPDQQLYVATVGAMGATPSPMAFPEVYLALKQGVIDGQENPAATIATNKFYEVQKYLTKTGHILGGNCFFIGTKALKKLTPEQQKAVMEAGREAADWINKTAFAAEDKCLEEISANGVTIIEEDQVDRAAFVKGAEKLYADYEQVWGKGLLGKVREIQ